MKCRQVSWIVALSLLLFVAVSRAEESARLPPRATHALSDFGPLDNPKQAQAAFDRAVEQLRQTGGILLVPADVWKQLASAAPLQGLVRTPAPPEETKRWQTGPGVTVVTADDKQAIVRVPPLSGLKIERLLNLADGDSLPHWGTHPMLTLDNRQVYGSTSYLDWLQAPVEKGKDRRFYVATVRGLHPGQFLNIHGGPGYGGGVTRACIKSVGYDDEKHMHYVVADTDLDHKAGAILHNKSNNGILHMLQTSNNDNQTYDVKVIRNQYAHGDTYMYYCDFNYMSNIHSAAGDENGNCYAAFIRSKENNFRGTVESMDWNAAQLKFGTSAQNIETLGDSRPLINGNPAKQLAAGKVLIVAGRTDYDLPDRERSVFEGRDYATGLVTNPITGSRERKFGGLIRGDSDCPWSEEVVGRFFALTEPSEKTPHGTLRWYLITKFQKNDDGTKDIEIERFWWGAKSAGSPTLYREDNYTWDGHRRPLAYVIAPGTYVNDVSRALVGGDRGGQRILGVVPHAGTNTKFDFEKGDPIEQAIGPDPFRPEAFRVWIWEDVPGQFPAAIIDAANHGAASRYSVVSVAGGPANLDDVAKRHEQKPAWDNVLVVNTAATVGLNLKADFAKAAILFQQPYHEQPIHWHYGHASAAADDGGKTGITQAVSTPPADYKVASLTVSRETGEFQFAGGGVQAGGSVSGVAGLSADAKAARNLRGKNVPVAATSTSIKVRFQQPEADGDYAVFLEQSWLSNRAISDKSPEGFTVTFASPAPDKATLDWMIVR